MNISWAIGYGGGSLLVPIMFAGIGEKTFYVFGALMFSYIPLVYCFLPETAGRTLEAIDFLFATDSWFTWNEEAEYRKRLAEFDNRVGMTINGKSSRNDSVDVRDEEMAIKAAAPVSIH